ncbi:pentatricopeptide repeat-containing protein At5g66520-like [Magnolia sinica]|uniref:pentatricopeptide repeat-containing protein At5g66520-like n=1 Tax=Magnolia sinica TaxID=86752 RepID=UPI00265861C4|nr:pentatricopeptide repeat-containing protein At5g66520-like [Magnolia sinica]
MSFSLFSSQSTAHLRFHSQSLPLSLLLKKCTALSQLQQIHAHIITSQPSLSLVIALFRSYTSFGSLTHARLLLDRFPSPHFPSTLLSNSLIQAYSKTPNSQESLHLFRRMLAVSGPAFPDKYTFTFVIVASSRQPSPEFGASVHGQVVRNGFASDVFVSNSMVNMYSCFGRMDDAQKLFDDMPQPDTVSWTSLIGGYTKRGEVTVARELFDKMPERNDVSWAVMTAGYVGSGRFNEALHLFHDMLHNHKVKPNEAVLVCVLSACAELGALDQGKWIHVYLDKSCVPKSSSISTALIDMYAKCGRVECATQVFDNMFSRDVCTWSSMITGLAMHGHGKEALRVFTKMLDEGINPDDILLLGVLNGCSHAGLVDEGCSIFNNMKHFWGIEPKIEHYGCLVDLLGRAGQLEKAYDFVKSMPVDPDIIIWRSLLSACRIHGYVDLGEQIIDHIAQLDPSSYGGGYALLSNLYASLGRWDKVGRVRKEMSARSKSNPGCSWIEIDGVVHEFLAADRLHPQIVEIRNELNVILKRISTTGYFANTKQVLFDLSEEDKEQAISWHSEKLAVAFGLMSTKSGSPIRIVKNLRICEDCHSAMEAISLVFDREIVVRDRSRFHTFKQGKCSCLDYW